jgi:integrase/recombinase XerC
MNNMPSITLDQATTMFLASIEFPRSTNTLQTYRKALETFSNMLVTQQAHPQKFPIKDLTENSVVLFVDYVKKFSPATESLYLQVLKKFFEFLVAENLAAVNLARVRMIIRQRSRRSKHQPDKYPEDDIKYLIEFMSNPQNLASLDNAQSDNLKLRNLRDRALVLTLADTGLRVEEICKLRCGDIDWESSRAILKGRGNKQAIVRFSTKAINAIRDYLSLRESLDQRTGQALSTLPLFARHDKGTGKKIKPITTTTIRRIVTERVDQIVGANAAATITPHTFLHYFVTTILRATGNLKLAQVLARHSNIQVTQKYAHIDDNELDKGYFEIFEKKNHPAQRE